MSLLELHYYSTYKILLTTIHIEITTIIKAYIVQSNTARLPNHSIPLQLIKVQSTSRTGASNEQTDREKKLHAPRRRRRFLYIPFEKERRALYSRRALTKRYLYSALKRQKDLRAREESERGKKQRR